MSALQNVKYVEIAGRTIAVKKLGLIKYQEMIDSLQEMIKSVNQIINFDALNNDDREEVLAQVVVTLVKKNIEQVIKFLTIAIDDLDYDFVAHNVGITDVIRLLAALLEVNEIGVGIQELKKLLTALTGRTIETK